MTVSALLHTCPLRCNLTAFVRCARPQLQLRCRTRAVVVRASHSAALPAPNMRDLARMAQLEVSEQEIKEWGPKISSIVEWFGQLQKADVAGVEPAVHAFMQGNLLRADLSTAYEQREQLLAQVPEMQGAFVKVPKITTAADADTAAAAALAAETGPAAPAAGDPAAAAPAAAPAAVDPALLAMLDIRVGRIVEIGPHPDADSLYVEKIDVGEAEPRTIVSGLKEYVPIEEMQNRMVVVICNLKPRNMRGIKSAGMLLAASDESHEKVDPLYPPEGATAGERVYFGANKDQGKAAEPNQVAKKKYWETVQPELRTDESKVANYKGLALMTSSGAVVSQKLANARIS